MADRPNLLLICVDHWPAYLLGSADHRQILTPTLDALAGTGIRFTQAYSAHPMCIPARRSLMTGTTGRTHGDRSFDEHLPMPEHLPTLAGTLGDAGYQCFGIGKLHVYPQRNRIGFHDVVCFEEGRRHLGMTGDDWEIDLAEHGHAGAAHAHGMGTNDFLARPWHLPERFHPTNWLTYQTCRMIRRRDPTRPSFWYVGYNYPHPPLSPLRDYLDMYDPDELPTPAASDWSQRDDLPWALRDRQARWAHIADHPRRQRLAIQAFYALCTHIDHQLRLIIGTLREEGELQNTTLVFTSDHGEMLGDHRMYVKALHYDAACRVPMLVVPASSRQPTPLGVTDDRLVELRDVMPTLLDHAGVGVPDTVEGLSMFGQTTRDHLYGEVFEDPRASRMIRDDRHKLIWYPYGNQVQLFDLRADPRETRDLADSAEHAPIRERLTSRLIDELYGVDEGWIRDGVLVGTEEPEFTPPDVRPLHGQRGWRFP